MKKIIVLAVLAIFSCLSISAEEITTTVNKQETTEARIKEAFCSNPYLYQTVTPSAETQDYSDVPGYTGGKVLRTVGIITTAAGVVIAGAFGAGAIAGANSDNVSGIFVCAAATEIALVGAGAAIAGGIMWACGNHKMRKARLSATSNGLAYNF